MKNWYFDEMLLGFALGAVTATFAVILTLGLAGYLDLQVPAIAIVENREDWESVKSLVERYGADSVCAAAYVAEHQLDEARP